MIRSRQVRRIVVSGILMGMVWTSGLWAQDPVLKMIPGDCLFCVRINGLDQTLGQLDQFLMGVSPVNVTMMAKMQLGQVLGNPMLAGVKTDGIFAIFAVAPAGQVEDPEAILNGLSILVPVSDYSQFTSSSPKIGKPDPNGVSELEGMGISVANLGNFALLGPSTGTLAATAKSLKAGATKPLAGSLDAGEVTAATQSPLWIYGNIQVLAKVLGPGITDKIKEAGAEIAKTPAGAAQGMDMKGFFAMYANMADTLLKETRSVAVTVTPKPNVLIVGATMAALPDTSMADLLTKPSSSGLKDAKLLGYLEDGAIMTGAFYIDPACLMKFNQKGLDFVATLGDKKLSDADTKQVKTLLDDLRDAMGKEAAFSMSMNPQAKSFFSVKYIYELKDKDKWLKMFDKVADLMNGPALAGLFDSTGMKIGFTVQHAAATYQGVPIDSAKATITLKDPNSPQAQMMQKMYGNFEYRMAVVGQFGVMAIGGDADADVRKLIDQAKAGGPKQMGKEIKAAMDILPEAKTADFIATYNIVRAISMMPAMMPMPMPLPNIQTKSNLVFAASMDKGKGMLQVGLPKEHLTEMMQVFQMMMMQQMQQKQQQPGGPKPTPQVQ